MNGIRAIGLVIYTYEEVEQSFDALWDWLRHVAEWSGHPYAEFLFARRGKESHRIGKATPKNLAALYQRLQTERPWYLLNLAWPQGSLQILPAVSGLDATVKSRWHPDRTRELYRNPSYVSLIAHPQLLARSANSLSEFLQLGVQLWEIIGGAYGFIDVETGIPLQDNLVRNFEHLYSNLVPAEFDREFQMWQRLGSCLNRRVWKAFWGNFLGNEHLEELGGIRAMQRADARYRRLPVYQAEAQRRAHESLRPCAVAYTPLARDGVLLTLSGSPFDSLNSDFPERVDRLQHALGRVALGSWDDEFTSPCETR